MSRLVTRSGLGLALCLVLSLASAGEACLPWGYGGYGYGTGYGYTTGYAAYYPTTAAYYGGNYGYANEYVGYGYGGGGYAGCCPSSLAPPFPAGCGAGGCAAPACCGGSSVYAVPACGSGCSPYPCSSDACGGFSCGNGCSTGDCLGGNCGIGNTPYSGEPVPDEGSRVPSAAPPTAPNKTYREEEPVRPSDGYQLPRATPQSGTQPQAIPQKSEDRPGQPTRTPRVLPPEEQDTPSSEERDSPSAPPDSGGFDFNFRTPGPDPAEAEPRGIDGTKAAEPLDLDAKFVYRVEPQRSRSEYRTIFRPPSVAKADVDAGSGWTPIKSGTAIAASR